MASNKVLNSVTGQMYSTEDGGNSYQTFGTALTTTGQLSTNTCYQPNSGFLSSTGSSTKSSNDGTTWNSNTNVASNATNAIVSTNGTLFLVGSSLSTTPVTPVLVSYSSTFIKTTRAVPYFSGASGGTIHSIIWNGSIFLIAMVGSTGGLVTATSADGITWTTGSSGFTTTPTSNNADAIWTGAAFELITKNNSAGTTLYRSTNGLSWTAVGASTSPTLEKLAANGDGTARVFVTGASTNQIQYSSNSGATWGTQNLPATDTWREVMWMGNYFLATGSTYNAKSTDGITWSSTALPGGNYTQLNRGSFGFNLWLFTVGTAISTSTSSIKKFFSFSRNAISSSQASTTRTRLLFKTVIAAVSNSFATFALKPMFVYCLAVSNTVSSSLTNKLYGNLWSIIYAFSKFVGVKAHSSVGSHSTNGSSWTAETLPSSQMWSSIATDGTTVIAIAKDTTAASKTTNGTTWSSSTLPTSRVWSSLTCKGTTFVAVALQSDKCSKSADGGSTWVEYSMPKLANWVSVSHNGTNFVAITDSSVAAYSTDGQTWTEVAMPANLHYNCVTWANSQFTAVASGPTDQGAKSLDGVSWTAITMPVSANWTNVGPGVGDPNV